MAKRKQYVQQATDLARVRYGPEISALTQLLADAATTRQQRVHQAVDARRYGVSSALTAIPAVNHAYQTAAAQINPAFAQGGGVEAQAMAARMAESQAQATAQLQDRRVAAIAGEGAARQQALSDYRTDVGKVNTRRDALRGEIGAYIDSTVASLAGADAKASAQAAQAQARINQQERDSLRSAGIDPDTGKPIPGGKLDPNAPKNKPKANKPGAADRAAATDYGKATSWLKTLDSPKFGQNLIKQGLQNTPATRREALKELLIKGNQVQGIPAIPQAVLAAALDMHFQGYLSQNTVHMLHQQGYKVNRLPNVTTTPQPGPLEAARLRVNAAPKDWLAQMFAALNVGHR